MLDTVTRYTAAIGETRWRHALRVCLNPLADRYSSQALTSAGLVIAGAGSALARIGTTAFWATASGAMVTLAANLVLPALTGLVIPANQFNVACFFVDASGTVTMLQGTAGATAGAVRFPQFPRRQALIGFLLITHTAQFTGGTTPLDTATTVYVSPTGPFDPTVLV